ncbi:hypothetical protein H8356DRAFT_1426553 [Neocallimastix lanati (nom. inval.)]|nr:hypothetical protein H8356DRAFT_1426553 [Neocallimastix sp. JGI-2020a]
MSNNIIVGELPNNLSELKKLQKLDLSDLDDFNDSVLMLVVIRDICRNCVTTIESGEADTLINNCMAIWEMGTHMCKKHFNKSPQNKTPISIHNNYQHNIKLIAPIKRITLLEIYP